MFLVFLLYALFASMFTIGKASLSFAAPCFIIGSRMAVAGLVMLIFQFFKDKKAFRLDKSSWIYLLLIAVFAIYVTNVAEFWGLQYLTSSKTCFLYSFSPFVSSLLSYFILKEVMNKRKWLGLICGCVGLVPMMLTHTLEEQAAGSFLVFSWPELALLIAVTASVLGWILIRKSVAHKNVSPFVVNGMAMFIGGIITLVHSRFVETWDPLPVTNWLGFAKTGLAMLVISNLVAYNLYGFLLKRYTATFMSFAGFSTAIFASLFGWAFLKETIPWQLWVSLGALFVSLYIFHQEEIKQGVFTSRAAPH